MGPGGRQHGERLGRALLRDPGRGLLSRSSKCSSSILLVLAIAADDRVEPVRVRQIVWTPLGYAASLAVILLGYYELHAVLFGTTLT